MPLQRHQWIPEGTTEHPENQSYIASKLTVVLSFCNTNWLRNPSVAELKNIKISFLESEKVLEKDQPTFPDTLSSKSNYAFQLWR